MITTESNKQLQTSLPVTPQHPAALQDGHVLHFTLGSQGPSQFTDDPLIVNIPSAAMTSALPAPPPLTGMAVTIDAPVVKMAEDHPVPIPYNGRCLVSFKIILFWPIDADTLLYCKSQTFQNLWSLTCCIP